MREPEPRTQPAGDRRCWGGGGEVGGGEGGGGGGGGGGRGGGERFSHPHPPS